MVPRPHWETKWFDVPLIWAPGGVGVVGPVRCLVAGGTTPVGQGV